MGLGPNAVLMVQGDAAVLGDGSLQIFLMANRTVYRECCLPSTQNFYDKTPTPGVQQIMSFDEFLFIVNTLNATEERHRNPW